MRKIILSPEFDPHGGIEGFYRSFMGGGVVVESCKRFAVMRIMNPPIDIEWMSEGIMVKSPSIIESMAYDDKGNCDMVVVSFSKMLAEKSKESGIASFIVDKRVFDNDKNGLELKILLKRDPKGAYYASLFGFDDSSGGLPISVYRHGEVVYDEKRDRLVWGTRPMGFESAIEIQIKGSEIGFFVVDPETSQAISTRVGRFVSMDDFNTAREEGVANSSGAENLFKQIFVQRDGSTS